MRDEDALPLANVALGIVAVLRGDGVMVAPGGRSQRRIVLLIGNHDVAFTHDGLEALDFGTGVDVVGDIGEELARIEGGCLRQQIGQRTAVGRELRFKRFGIGSFMDVTWVEGSLKNKMRVRVIPMQARCGLGWTFSGATPEYHYIHRLVNSADRLRLELGGCVGDEQRGPGSVLRAAMRIQDRGNRCTLGR